MYVFVGTLKESYHERHRRPDKLRHARRSAAGAFWYADAGAAFILLQFAAIEERLASGVFGVLPEPVPAVKALLNVPDDVHFVCLVTIGRPVTVPQETALVSRLSQRRLALDELVRWERWEAPSSA